MSALQEYRLTFGTRHAGHPNLPEAHPDGWVSVWAPTYQQGRAHVVELLGSAWSDFGPPLPEDDFYYPRGCLTTLVVGASTCTDLVPLQRVQFYPAAVWDDRIGRAVPRPVRWVEELPTETSDPRAMACLDHHVACPCREAMHAELLAESRSEADTAYQLHRRLEGILRLHAPVKAEWSHCLYPEYRCSECGPSWPCPTVQLAYDHDRAALDDLRRKHRKGLL